MADENGLARVTWLGCEVALATHRLRRTRWPVNLGLVPMAGIAHAQPMRDRVALQKDETICRFAADQTSSEERRPVFHARSA